MTPEPFKDDWGRFWLRLAMVFVNIGVALFAYHKRIDWFFWFSIAVACLNFSLLFTYRSPHLFLLWFTRMVWNALRGEV